MLLLPNICNCFLAENLHGVSSRIVYCMVTVVLFLLPSFIFKARTFFAVQSILLFLAVIELSHLFLYGETTSILYVNTFLLSEPRELQEMGVTLWPVILLYLLYIASYYVILVKKIRQVYFFNKSWRIILSICFTLFAAGLLVPSIVHHTSQQRLLPIDHVRFDQTDLLLKQKKVFPINIYIALGDIISDNIFIKKEQEKLSDFSFHIPPKTDNDQEIYILIIGETARYGNFGINGYTRNTTPNLDTCSNLISFDSIYSVANLTAVSLPFMLTRATPQMPNARYNEKSVVEAFAEAGFFTAWIANQSFGNEFLRRIATSCDYTHYEPPSTNNHSTYDMSLLSQAMPLLEDSTQMKKMIVLHSEGCHFRYNNRYPETFAVFQPMLEPNFSMRLMDRAHRSLILNTYDNAILYTDFFIYSTIEALQSLNSVAAVFYISDHGENLFDDKRNMILHGTYAGSEYEYHVPMFVWTSDKYKEKYPQKVAAMQANKTKLQSANVVFHSLLDMADIQYLKLDSTLSIAQPALVADSIIYGVDANLKLTVIHQHSHIKPTLPAQSINKRNKH
jgi:glucan phosphoethanolaminetransferase (alkaline phosphatase superfamily)